MARELIKFSNDKKGFRTLLAVEALAALWALSAVVYAVIKGRSNTMVYGGITLFATLYIFARSLSSYRKLVAQERGEAKKEETKP
ncbi:MAG: hypothetical protein K6G54_00620 [Oscillospiraceae bacterium]|nr:hypothetical protein [Oscillospiraceae bacterium]